MSIQLQCNKTSLAEKKDSEIHLMPCKINHDGHAEVSGFFTPYIDGNVASFRGYPLNGEMVKIPEGYSGFVISEFQKPLSDKGDRTLTVQKKFEKINYWNWDQPTDQQDPIQQSLDWLTVSKMIHQDDE